VLCPSCGGRDSCASFCVCSASQSALGAGHRGPGRRLRDTHSARKSEIIMANALDFPQHTNGYYIFVAGWAKAGKRPGESWSNGVHIWPWVLGPLGSGHWKRFKGVWLLHFHVNDMAFSFHSQNKYH